MEMFKVGQYLSNTKLATVNATEKIILVHFILMMFSDFQKLEFSSLLLATLAISSLTVDPSRSSVDSCKFFFPVTNTCFCIQCGPN